MVPAPGERPALLRELPDQMALVDEAGVVQDANESLPEVLRPDRERPPCTLEAYFEPRFLAESGLASLLERARASGHEETSVTWAAAGGGVLHLFVEVRPLAGRGICSLVRVLDLTERVAFERALKDGEHRAMLGRLLGTLAHELSNPVTGVRVLAEILRERVGPREREYVDEIATLSDRMTSTLRDLERLFGPAGERSERVDLQQEAQRAADLAARWPVAEGKRIECRQAERPGPFVVAVPGRLRLALENLLENALEAVDEGGEVRIAAEREAGSAVVAVEDSGPGVDPRVKDRLFQPFFSRKRGGTGLGLAIVRTVAQELGGTAEAGRSEDLGGARFVLRLPPAPERSGAKDSGS